MVLPQGVLRGATNRPVLVELKNGDSYSGTLVASDNLMNLRMENVQFTPHSEYKFERLAECLIRGQFVKFVRFPDSIIGEVMAEEALAESGKGRGKGRGKGKDKGDSQPWSPPTVLTVPAPLVGTLIGKGGETIKKITMESGAHIKVAKDQASTEGSSSSAEERNVYLSGPPEAVERAKSLIQKLVQEKADFRMRRDRPPRQGAYRGDARQSTSLQGGLSSPSGSGMEAPHPYSQGPASPKPVGPWAVHAGHPGPVMVPPPQKGNFNKAYAAVDVVPPPQKGNVHKGYQDYSSFSKDVGKGKQFRGGQ